MYLWVGCVYGEIDADRDTRKRLYVLWVGGVCGEINAGWVPESKTVCICEWYRDGRVVTCFCVMISVLLHFEDVFGRRNQGRHWGGGCMWGDRRRLGYKVCVRKLYWKGCGNAATARGCLDTAWSHSSVIWNSNHFIERVGRRGQLNSWGWQKRTSGRPTADLHLANPSSCFFDPAWWWSSSSCLRVEVLLNFNQNQWFVIRQILTDSELTIHDSIIWVLSEFLLESSF